MKTFYRFVILVLTNLLSIVFGFVLGGAFAIAKQEKDRASETKTKTEISKTDTKSDRTDGRKRVVGFSYDEAES